MKIARVRLIVAVLLVAGWFGFLGYLALGRAAAVVLSRSQLLVATQVVKAEIALDDAGKPVSRVQVQESFGGRQLPADKKSIIIENLGEARLPGGKPLTAAGIYALPLEQTGLEQFRVVGAAGHGGGESSRLFLIYPWNGDVERQVRERMAPRTNE